MKWRVVVEVVVLVVVLWSVSVRLELGVLVVVGGRVLLVVVVVLVFGVVRSFVVVVGVVAASWAGGVEAFWSFVWRAWGWGVAFPCFAPVRGVHVVVSW